MPRLRKVKRKKQTDFPRVVFFDVTTQNRPRSLGRLKRVQKPEDLRFFTKPQMCTYRSRAQRAAPAISGPSNRMSLPRPTAGFENIWAAPIWVKRISGSLAIGALLLDAASSASSA